MAIVRAAGSDQVRESLLQTEGKADSFLDRELLNPLALKRFGACDAGAWAGRMVWQGGVGHGRDSVTSGFPIIRTVLPERQLRRQESRSNANDHHFDLWKSGGAEFYGVAP